jgi:glycosyltransferase involved in cell wall biosynthesis/tetratricopeptide (TPR) repeat protein
MTHESPKASVLISTFNRPDYLREAIQSVVDQRMTDWELLVLNDGGVDVADVVASFQDPRIRYFPDDVNKGAAHRFNQGLEQSRGEYITYLGDDDLFYPNHLEVLAKALDDHPQAGLAYSDLYAVSCVRDDATGRRYVLDKRIMVSRDFNREFMFHYNHVLHVSLMHRREAAFRVGCFDESVKVLIEWSLNRRLCFCYDFVHVPEATGEYYMPVFKSDRISVVQRKDKESYKQNVRRIRTSFPPEPWPFIDKVALIHPVYQAEANLAQRVMDLIDNIDHPFHLYLVNNTGRTEKEFRTVLGRLNELGGIHVLTPPKRLPLIESYRFGAKQTSAAYLFLITENLKIKDIPKRLFGGLAALKELGKTTDGIKWQVEDEKKTPFDILTRKDNFLKKSDPNRKNHQVQFHTLGPMVAAGFKFDVTYAEHRRQFSQGQYQDARRTVEECLAIPKGAPGIQFLIHNYHRTLMALEDYEPAEKEIRALIDRGYLPDNYIRLGQVLQAQKRFGEALEAYRRALDSLHFDRIDFDSRIFPFNFPKELGAFTAMMGLGECAYETGQAALASQMFHRASKTRANSHKPFLGFAKLFLTAGQLDRAEVVLAKIGPRDGAKDPETQRLMGKLCERRGRLDLAFECHRKAFQYAPFDEANIDAFYFAGAGLKQWDDMKPPLEGFLAKRPDHVKALTRLASIYLQTRDYDQAAELTRRGLTKDPASAVLRSIEKRLADLVREAPPVPVPAPDPLAPGLVIPSPFQIGDSSWLTGNPAGRN